MSYKTILVHVDASKHAAQRIRIAARLAHAQEAHLVGAAMTGIAKLTYEAGILPHNDSGLASVIDAMHERARQALESFESIAKQEGVRSYEKRLLDDEAGEGISLQARYADLVVISQTDREDTTASVTAAFPDYVSLNCSRPVLIVPHTGNFPKIGNKILIAWDGGREASSAITNALPLLRQAQLVQVAVFNPQSRPSVHGEQPGADIALYLARHGVKVEVIQKNTQGDIGNALLNLAVETTTDMIVMGSYGHSRFREILLGGVTRTILESMTVPVLMAH